MSTRAMLLAAISVVVVVIIIGIRYFRSTYDSLVDRSQASDA